MNSEIREKLKNTILVIPSLNPDEKLVRTVEGMIEEGFSRVVLVNDGSDKDHMEPFEILCRHPECIMLDHGVNKGKGRALKTAFEYIYTNYKDADGVVTADGDGQHTPEDTVAVGIRLAETKNKVIMGCRNFYQKGLPFHNTFGNRITSGVFALFCGVKLSDTQTGLRGIPSKLLKDFCEIEGERFEYESNMLLYMGRNSIPYEEVAIQTLYLEGNKSSHFRVVSDSYRIYKPIILYMMSSIGSTVVDLLLFTILAAVFSGLPNSKSILIATVGARICSSLLNYYLNSHKVFKSKQKASISLLRYYILCVCQMMCSYLGVTGLVTLLAAKGLVKTAVKVVVDTILFILSFRIQHAWVFNDKKK